MRTKICVLLTLLSFAFTVQAFNIPGFSSKKETEKAAPSEADISKSLTESIDKAKSSFSDNPEMKSLLDNISKEAGSGEDLSMIQNLSGLSDLAGGSGADAMLTDGQKQIMEEVRGHAQALALTRNFSSDPAMSGPVTHAVNAVQSKDPAAAVASLKEISSAGSLSPMQTELLKGMLGNYGGYADKASKAMDAASSIKSLF